VQSFFILLPAVDFYFADEMMFAGTKACPKVLFMSLVNR